MRRFVSVIVAAAGLCCVAGGAVIVWRRNARVGTAFVARTDALTPDQPGADQGHALDLAGDLVSSTH